MFFVFKEVAHHLIMGVMQEDLSSLNSKSAN